MSTSPIGIPAGALASIMVNSSNFDISNTCYSWAGILLRVYLFQNLRVHCLDTRLYLRTAQDQRATSVVSLVNTKGGELLNSIVSTSIVNLVS